MQLVKVLLGTLVLMAAWTVTALWGAFAGWWLEPIAPPGDDAAFFDAAVQIIDAENRGSAALVLIHDGEVLGSHFAARDGGIDRDTLFPTASMSKWATAWGVMKLVEEGRLDLDAPVSEVLTRWRLPPGDFDERGVTARRLLSHTAGLADELGFGDFTADETLPTLEQTLARPHGSSDREVVIALGHAPGSRWMYSGGSYLILELLIEEITGIPFEQYMQEAIFTPLELRRSTYRYLGALDNVTPAYDATGAPAAHFQYASSAATGLATTAADWTRFLLAQFPDRIPARPLGQASIDAMRTPHASLFGAEIWGLGTILFAPTPGGDYVFGHDGGNEPAINAAARVNPETQDAILVLANGNPRLATRLGFEWVLWQTGTPDFLLTDRVLESAVPPIVVGNAVLLVLGAGYLVRARKLARHA